jgi:hypothetical protein
MEKVTLRASIYVDIVVEKRDRRNYNQDKLLKRIKNILLNISDKVSVVNITNFEPVLEEWAIDNKYYYDKTIVAGAIDEYKVSLERKEGEGETNY